MATLVGLCQKRLSLGMPKTARRQIADRKRPTFSGCRFGPEARLEGRHSPAKVKRPCSFEADTEKRTRARDP